MVVALSDAKNISRPRHVAGRIQISLRCSGLSVKNPVACSNVSRVDRGHAVRSPFEGGIAQKQSDVRLMAELALRTEHRIEGAGSVAGLAGQQHFTRSQIVSDNR